MSRKQTRRSISVSGTVYDRLRAHVDEHGTTCSGVVEDLLREFFEMPDRDRMATIAPIPRFERKVAKKVVVTTPVLEKNGDWTEIAGQTESGPASRVKVIKDAHEAKAAFEKKPEPDKEGLKKLDQASKIFTF